MAEAERERSAGRGPFAGYAQEIAVAVIGALLIAGALRTFVLEPFRIPSASMAPTLLPGDHIVISKLRYGVRVPFVNRWALRWEDPRRGDVVVFAHPAEPDRDYVKRVIGVAGDVVELRNQTVYVNGVPQPRERAGEVDFEETLSWGAGPRATERCPAWREALAVGPLAAVDGATGKGLSEAFDAAAAAGVVHHLVLQCGGVRFGEREGPFEQVAPGHVFVLGDNRDRSGDSRSAGGWQVPVANVRGKAIVIWWSQTRRWAIPPWAHHRVDRLFKRID